MRRLVLLLCLSTSCSLPHSALRGAPMEAGATDLVDDLSEDRGVTPEDAALDETEEVVELDASTEAGPDSGVDSGGDSAVDSGVDGTGVDASDADASGCPLGQFDCGNGRCRPVLGTVNTCREASSDGVYVLTVGGRPWCSYCLQSGSGDRWTLVLRANGSNEGGRDGARFGYDSPLWTNEETYQPWEVDAADTEECKLRGFSVQSFTELRMVLARTDGSERNELVRAMGRTVSSLRSVLMGGLNQFSNLWTAENLLDLVSEARLQAPHRRTGFNVAVMNPNLARVRIGAVGDESMTFGTPDSYLGFGGSFRNANPPAPNFSVGNVARHNGDAGRTLPLYGLLYVR
jgi:hypothetical protein